MTTNDEENRRRLSDILASLRSYATPTSTAQSAVINQAPPSQASPSQGFLNQTRGYQEHGINFAPLHAANVAATHVQFGSSLPLPRQEPVATRQTQAMSERRLITADTIITWPSALRCVMQMARDNPLFHTTIQKMVRDQQKHEALWHKGLEAIVQQANTTMPDYQNGETATHPDVVKQIQKIYAAQQEMNRVMSSELKTLGVPFFGTKSNLIKPSSASHPVEQTNGQAKASITQEELLELQRKMIQHLEDAHA